MNLDFSFFFKGIADETRQRIINLLFHYPSLNVNELSMILEIPQSKVSRHLAHLRNAQWVQFNRRDKWVYYRLNPQIDGDLIQALNKMFSEHLLFRNDLSRAGDLIGNR